jgi:hypothetical protein
MMVGDDPWWLPGCRQNIAKIPGGVLCDEQHCTDSQNYWHMVCSCQSPYGNGCPTPPTPNCCSYTATSPIYVSGPKPCYCCCGCLANETLVHSGKLATKAIKEFMVGDPVYVAMDAQLTSWREVPVQFSSGTGDNAVSDMIEIRFGAPESRHSVVATRSQLFMVQGNKLKRASRLVPQQDSLMRPDGSLLAVRDLTAGKFTGGVHAIATTDLVSKDPAGHLMIYNGVVGGDYALQVTDLGKANPELLVDGHEDLPEFGTRAYAEKYAHLFADTLKAYAADATYEDDEHTPGFEPLAAALRPRIHGESTAFITDQQAEDILKNAPREPPYSGAGKDILNYLFKIYRGFYPNITFYLDDANEQPNAYSLREFGSAFVVVNGGLIRTDAIQYEALAFVIAHQIGVLQGGDPKDPEGYTCRGQADYTPFLAVFPYVWFGVYSHPMVQPAIDQITRFFDYIDLEHRGGIPGDTCNGISIDCRVRSMVASYNVQPLPECAGGPPTATLAVTGATAAEDGLTVTVTFNEKVDVATAELPGNYSFSPLAPTAKAKAAADGLSVTVSADFRPDTDYLVKVEDVLSATGHPLIDAKSTAAFRTPPPVG